ncbi:hypothetical protein ABK040_011576 [Willaertia magna]
MNTTSTINTTILTNITRYPQSKFHFHSSLGLFNTTNTNTNNINTTTTTSNSSEQNKTHLDTTNEINKNKKQSKNFINPKEISLTEAIQLLSEPTTSLQKSHLIYSTFYETKLKEIKISFLPLLTNFLKKINLELNKIHQNFYLKNSNTLQNNLKNNNLQENKLDYKPINKKIHEINNLFEKTVNHAYQLIQDLIEENKEINGIENKIGIKKEIYIEFMEQVLTFNNVFTENNSLQNYIYFLQNSNSNEYINILQNNYFIKPSFVNKIWYFFKMMNNYFHIQPNEFILEKILYLTLHTKRMDRMLTILNKIENYEYGKEIKIKNNFYNPFYLLLLKESQLNEVIKAIIKNEELFKIIPDDEILIKCLEYCNDLNLAKSLKNIIINRYCKDNNYLKNIKIINNLIKLFGKLGDGLEAFLFYLEMLKEGIKPNAGTFIYLLSGCRTSNLKDIALLVFQSLKRLQNSNEMNNNINIIQYQKMFRSMCDLNLFNEVEEYCLNNNLLRNERCIWFDLLLETVVDKEEIDIKDFESRAERYFRKVMEIDENYITAMFVMRKIYKRFGREEEAEQLKKRMIKLLGNVEFREDLYETKVLSFHQEQQQQQKKIRTTIRTTSK